jgi:hypothetical protein
MNRELTQTAIDGETRTFHFFRDRDGNPWITIKERDKSGQTTSTKDFRFTEEERVAFARYLEIL